MMTTTTMTRIERGFRLMRVCSRSAVSREESALPSNDCMYGKGSVCLTALRMLSVVGLKAQHKVHEGDPEAVCSSHSGMP